MSEGKERFKKKKKGLNLTPTVGTNWKLNPFQSLWIQQQRSLPKVIKLARSNGTHKVYVYFENLFCDVEQGLGVQCLCSSFKRRSWIVPVQDLVHGTDSVHQNINDVEKSGENKTTSLGTPQTFLFETKVGTGASSGSTVSLLNPFC